MIDRNDHWKPATLTETNLPNDALPFVLTPADRTKVAIVQCDIERMQRRYREPEGLEVGTATEAEFESARAEFRRTL